MDGLPPLTQKSPLIGAGEGHPQTPAVSPVRRWAALAVIGTLAVAAVASLGHQVNTHARVPPPCPVNFAGHPPWTLALPNCPLAAS